MKTQGRFLWQNWPPGWVVSRSGVTSVGGGTKDFGGGVGVLLHLSKSGVGIFWPAKNFRGGYFYICPNLVSEFFSWNFFWASQKFRRGVLLCLSKCGVGIFWPKFFSASQKFWRGYFYISPKMTEFFPNHGGYQNMKTSECHETSRYAKNVWPMSILCWPFWAPKFWLNQLWQPFWPTCSNWLGSKFLLKLHILS